MGDVFTRWDETSDSDLPNEYMTACILDVDGGPLKVPCRYFIIINILETFNFGPQNFPGEKYQKWTQNRC